MKKLKDIRKSVSNLMDTENILTVLFLLGLFIAIVGLLWFIWLCLGALLIFSLPLFLFAIGLLVMAITYGLSYLRR